MMRFVRIGVSLCMLIGWFLPPLAAQEKGEPVASTPEEVGIEAKHRLERLDQIRGPQKELRISPANVVIHIRPPDADPLVDFSYAVLSLTLKKPVEGVQEITYWAYSLSDAITLGQILREGGGVEVTVRCPARGDTSKCWFESFILR